MNLELRHKIVLEFIISIILLVFYITLFANVDKVVEQSVYSSFDSQLFPKATLMLLILLSGILFIDCFRMWNNFKKGNITHYMRTLVTDGEEQYPLGRIFAYLAILFLYLAGFYYLGFVYSTPLVMVCTSYLLGMRNLVFGAIFAIILTLVLDYASLHLLQIMLPEGALFY